MSRLTPKQRLLTSLLLVPLLALGACSDDDGPSDGGGDPLDALVGSYTTQSFTYTADDGSATANLTRFELGIRSLTVNADGTFTGLVVLPDETGAPQEIPLSGSLTNVTNTSLTINFSGVAAQILDDLDVNYTLSGDVFTFTATDVSFDFTLQGNPEVPADLTVVLLRN